MIKNTVDSYGTITKTFHWLMAVLIIGMLIFGFIMKDLELRSVYYIHKAIGFLVLILTILRFVWRVNNIAPKYSETMPKLMVFGANAMHYALYILMILVPLSGYLMSNSFGYPVHFFGIEMPFLIEKNFDHGKLFSEAHELSAFTLLGLIALHILGALKHRFFDKPENDVLKRMV
jgi:cytochrome b561